MSQITIYLPEDLEKKAKKKALKNFPSLSSYFADLIKKDLAKNRKDLDFKDLFGTCAGTLPNVEKLEVNDVNF